jgi:hypothetical protein
MPKTNFSNNIIQTKTVQNCFIAAGCVAGAGLGVYLGAVYIPYIAMESAKAGTTGALQALPGSYFVPSSLVNQMSTVAAGKAYATVEAMTGVGANTSTALAFGAAGWNTGYSLTKAATNQVSKAFKYLFYSAKTSNSNKEYVSEAIEIDNEGYELINSAPQNSQNEEFKRDNSTWQDKVKQNEATKNVRSTRTELMIGG